MKTKLITILSLILISNGLFGQLNVNAGSDTSFCFNNQDSVKIGGKPTAWGGTEPYTYTWTVDSHLSAKQLLNDTTASNPIVISSFNDMTFKLTVKDNSGTVNYDSVKINSIQILQTLIYFNPEIDKGDTLTLPHNEFHYGIEPYSYYWKPNYNISDTNYSNPKAWPDTSVRYTVYVIDSIGCKSGHDYVDVSVNNTLNLNQIESDLAISKVFPNPINGSSLIYFQAVSKVNYNLSVMNANGQIILWDSFNSDYYNIGQRISTNGAYLYFIHDGDNIISVGRFIK